MTNYSGVLGNKTLRICIPDKALCPFHLQGSPHRSLDDPQILAHFSHSLEIRNHSCLCIQVRCNGKIYLQIITGVAGYKALRQSHIALMDGEISLALEYSYDSLGWGLCIMFNSQVYNNLYCRNVLCVI